MAHWVISISARKAGASRHVVERRVFTVQAATRGAVGDNALDMAARRWPELREIRVVNVERMAGT